jgi:hypothetical protein
MTRREALRARTCATCGYLEYYDGHRCGHGDESPVDLIYKPDAIGCPLHDPAAPPGRAAMTKKQDRPVARCRCNADWRIVTGRGAAMTIRCTARIRRALRLIVVALEGEKVAGENWLTDDEEISEQDIQDAIDWIAAHADWPNEVQR